MKKSAVLIVISGSNQDKSIILTKRANSLRDHANQICIPSGRVENHESHKTAALREFGEELGEELGVNTQGVDIIGELSSQITSTEFCIYPFIGVLDKELVLTINKNEVPEIIKIPLENIANLENYKINNDPSYKTIRHKYCFTYKHHFIWGVTASILRDFAVFMTINNSALYATE